MKALAMDHVKVQTEPLELNLFHSLLIKCYHQWRVLLRCRKNVFLSQLFQNSKHRGIPKPKGRLIIPTLYGFKMIIDAGIDRIQGHSIYYNGTYEAGTLYIMAKCLSSGNCFIDIGSNLGLMSLYASQRVGSAGRVLAFEPEPETFKVLKSNVELNKSSNIELFPFAMGASKGKAIIYASKTNRGFASLMQSEELTGNASEVNIERLDDILSEKNLHSVQMMKIDVEGWELEVLKGSKSLLSQENAPVLCIESRRLYPMHNGTPADLFTFLTQINNYQIYRFINGKERISKLTQVKTAAELPENDNIFCFLPNQRKLNAPLFCD